MRPDHLAARLAASLLLAAIPLAPATPALAVPATALLLPSAATSPQAPIAADVAPSVTIASLGPLAFTPNGDGRADTFQGTVTMSAPGPLSVVVTSFEGVPVATLLDAVAPAGTIPITWDGAGAPDGPYTIVATAGSSVAALPISRWSTRPEVVRPRGIVVLLDPGHGGDDPGGGSGQLPDGTWVYERSTTLDVVLKAGAMLSAAGFVVRYTRTSDVTVGLAQRAAIANAWRADAFISIHMNSLAPGEGRTEDFFCATACRGHDSSDALAQAILDAHRTRLAPFVSATWQPAPSPSNGWTAKDDYIRWVEDGCTDVIRCHFAVLGPYSATVRPTAIVMPGALVESLAATNPTELAMMADPAVRTQLAAAFADGIAAFFATRPVWVRLDRPGQVPPLRMRTAAFLPVKVTNTGTAPIPAGSAIVVGDRTRTTTYDSSIGTKGTTIGVARLTADLAPGGQVSMRVRVVPRTLGNRTWKIDLIVGGVRVSDLRVPTLQVNTRVR